MSTQDEKDIEYILRVIAHPEMELTAEFRMWMQDKEHRKLYKAAKAAHDAIALKGGKGPWADQDTQNNGANRNVIIEDCTYGFCHSALTCGSESIHNHNIVLRRIQVDQAQRLLWLKMRPDTPQNYEYITVENITGNVTNLLYVKPWTQFFDLKGRKDIPYSYSSHISMRNIDIECNIAFNIDKADDQYKLSDFTFENLQLKAKEGKTDLLKAIEGVQLKNVKINGQEVDL